MDITKPERSIFVVMPFKEANGRSHEDLTYFFNQHIKKPIEEASDLAFRYVVRRSETELSMTDSIIASLVNADLVICDVSGPRSNANVMYELGIRFSVSDKPVILIRETSPDNQTIFDIHGLYQQSYTQNRIAHLEQHLLSKIKAYESGAEVYESPILKSINSTSVYWSVVPKNKACAFLGGLALAAEAALRIFGSQVQTHLLERDKSLTPYPPNEVYKILQTISDPTLLNGFEYSFGRLPPLDNYLSSVYLMGLIGEDIERQFREFLLAYSINFLSNQQPYVQMERPLQFTAYAAETLILVNLCRSLIRLLQARSGSSEAQQATSLFESNAQRSNLRKALYG